MDSPCFSRLRIADRGGGPKSLGVAAGRCHTCPFRTIDTSDREALTFAVSGKEPLRPARGREDSMGIARRRRIASLAVLAFVVTAFAAVGAGGSVKKHSVAALTTTPVL